MASEVVAGAGVFEELADDVTAGVDEDPHGYVDVAADLLADVVRDVGQLLVEDGADDVWGLRREVRVGCQ